MRLINEKLVGIVEDCSYPPKVSYDYAFNLGAVRLPRHIEDYLYEKSPRILRYGRVIYITSKLLLNYEVNRGKT